MVSDTIRPDFFMSTFLQNLSATNARVEGLRADFAQLENVNEVITKVLKRLQTRREVQTAWNTMSMHMFDGWFEPLVRKELGKVLAIVRAKAVQKAQAAGAKDAAHAVLRRMYRDELKGNVNILGNRKRISSRTRPYPERTGGVSGIRRNRIVSDRTREIYEYYGPDRAFILRFLEYGTDVRTARPGGAVGRGSKATYGNRGSIGARSFFGSVSSDMQTAAEQLGTTLVNYVEQWLDETFNNVENK